MMKIPLMFHLLLQSVLTIQSDVINFDKDTKNVFEIFLDLKQKEQQINQLTVQNLTCFYTIKIEDLSQFLHFELLIEDSMNFLDNKITSTTYVSFSATIGKPPFFIEETSQIIAQFVDYNGFQLNKKYYHLLIPPNSDKFQADAQIFINVFIPSLSIYKYRLKISRNLTKPCALNCIGLNQMQGVCKDGNCICQQSMIDEDCSVPAIRIFQQQKQNYTQFISPNEKYYFYFEPTELSENNLYMNFKLEKSNNPVQKLDFYLKRELRLSDDELVFLPTEKIHTSSNYLMPEKNTFQYKIPKGHLIFSQNLNRFERLLIVMNGNYPDVIAISFLIEKENYVDDQGVNIILIYFLVSIAATLIIVWILITIIRIRYQRQNQIHDQNRIRNRIQGKNSLNQNTIDKFMPKFQYSEIYEQEIFKFRKQVLSISILKRKEKVQDESCSICLIEFQNTELCRSTPCLHIFHSECLEQWLKKNETCPVCRAELTEKELNEKAAHYLSAIQIQDQSICQLNQGAGLNQTGQPEQQRQSLVYLQPVNPDTFFNELNLHNYEQE